MSLTCERGFMAQAFAVLQGNVAAPRMFLLHFPSAGGASDEEAWGAALPSPNWEWDPEGAAVGGTGNWDEWNEFLASEALTEPEIVTPFSEDDDDLFTFKAEVLIGFLLAE
jgi:hypothetical protein